MAEVDTTFREHYEFIKPIAKGGGGKVYQVWNRRLDREEAMKRLHLATDGALENRKLCLREVRTQGRCNHPNIATLFDWFEVDRHLIITMEYLRGGSLADRLADGPLDPATAVSYSRQLLSGLEHAHGRGIIHRDLKPSNILFTEHGIPKLTDFGIAKLLDEPALTCPGNVRGSPKYIAPEQLQGKAVDHRADLFAFGIVLFEMVTGALPFPGDTTEAILFKICHEPATHPAEVNASVPVGLSPIILKALEKDPGSRFQSASEFSHALSAVFEPRKEAATISVNGIREMECKVSATSRTRNARSVPEWSGFLADLKMVRDLMSRLRISTRIFASLAATALLLLLLFSLRGWQTPALHGPSLPSPPPPPANALVFRDPDSIVAPLPAKPPSGPRRRRKDAAPVRVFQQPSPAYELPAESAAEPLLPPPPLIQPNGFTIPAASFASPTIATLATLPTIWLYRPNRPDLGNRQPTVYLDGEALAKMDNGRFLGIAAEPGVHELWVGDGRERLGLVAMSGQDHHLRVEVRGAFWWARPQLQLVSSEVARHEIRTLKQLGPKKILIASRRVVAIE